MGFTFYFLTEKFVYSHGDILFFIYTGSGPHFAGAAVLFVLSLPCSGCVLQVSGIISDG